ncbi:hypothetical protein FQ087_18295 [Sporosarcina sp. ANT_H38]|uniref:hypothetical protein n=1 Tax=Sporosarcina sp. ANT_H38 TaxID=2597358 RepID=UPI0011F3C654|nr:hypothetical protein [Sporosarcina sp. ANT_H38]KAA0944077.1 hypothetical protein FQ087_18295 [Sporosarcina sp. ANT_H38]
MGVREIMAKATAAVEFMYDKTAEIKRYVEYEKPSGADGMRWEAVHLDVPCRLSSIKLDNTVQGDANAIRYDIKLILSSDFKVLPGDEVYVSSLVGVATDTVKYESAKEPFVYVSHQEVLLIRKGHA